MKKLLIIFLSVFILFSTASFAQAAKKTTPAPQKIKPVQKSKTIQKTQPKTVTKQKPAQAKKSTNVKKKIPAKKQTPKKTNTQQKSTQSKKPAGNTSKTTKTTGSDIAVSYKVRGGSLFITFGNLKSANSVSYTLMYETNGQQEGAMGTINPKGSNTATRSLLFGTCSKNVCRYHSNISDITLEVTANLKSGKTLSKVYPINF